MTIDADLATVLGEDGEEFLASLTLDFVDKVTAAWAGAIRQTAPIGKTLQLSGTAHSDGDQLKLVYYWAYVAYGHRIRNSRSSPFVQVAKKDAQGNITFADKRTDPNPYMEEAWDSAAVQSILEEYKQYGITMDYPLKRIVG